MNFLSYFASPSRNHPDEQAHFRTVLLTFMGNGMQTGVWVVLIPDLASALRLSASALGVALATLAAAQMAGVVLGGWLADRMGRRPFLVLGAAGAGLFYLLLTLVGSYIALLSLSVLCGLTLGFLDMVLNTLGGDHERQHGTKVMGLFHAGHDGASSLGALVGGLVLWLGLGFRMVYVALGALLLLLAVASIRLPIPRHQPKRKHVAAQPSDQEHERQTPLWLLKGVVLAAVFVGLVSLTEAALSGYGNIYLRDILGSGPLMGAVGILGFLAAVTLGRLASNAAVRRVGERIALIAAGIGTAAATILIVTTTSPLVAVFGLAMLGIFESPIAPVSFSLAARSAIGRVGQAVAAVTVAGGAAFLLGPLIVGVLADLFSLRSALSIFILTSLGIAGLVYRRL